MHVARGEEGPALKVGHVLLESAQEDRVLPGSGGFLQDRLAREKVGLEQVQEQAELFWVALVRGCRQEEQMRRGLGQDLSQPIPLGSFDLPSVPGGGELVRLVHDNQIPRHAAQVIDVGFALGKVQAGDDVVVLFPERLTEVGAGGLAVGNHEGFVELLLELSPPLVGKVGGGYHQNAFQYPAVLELL